jgi:hypothetical protein
MYAMHSSDVHIHDILLQVALGHNLTGSQSCFAVFYKEILQNALVKAITEAYWEVNWQSGLLGYPRTLK